MLTNFKRQITKIIKDKITIKPLKNAISSKASKKLVTIKYVKKNFFLETLIPLI